MNQNAYPNMGGAHLQQANHHVGGMQRDGGGSSSDVRNHIMNIIQRNPVPPGWQQTVPPGQRAGIIHQMVTGLQIVKPDMTLQYAINVATGFESQQFNNCPNQETYNVAWRSKLEDIRKTRQEQANAQQQQQFQNQQPAQMGMTPQQMQGRTIINQNQLQPGFGMSQGQQPGQNIGIPMQQQLSQNPRLFPGGNGPEMQQPMQNGQSMQNVPRPGPQNRGQPQLTPQENQQINNMTLQIMTRMTDQDKLTMRQRLSQVPIEQQQAMRANGIDPMHAWARSQALRTFDQERMKRRQLAAQGISGLPSGAVPPQSHPTSQMSLHGQQQPHPGPTSQHPDPSFGAGHLDQFVGQQQDALRLQAAGQDVVPASNVQGTPAQVRANPHQQPQGQFGPNRMQVPGSFQTQPQPQSQWNVSQSQQQNIPQTPSMPMQTPTLQPPTPNFTNAQGKTPQQQALQGQLGGLNNNRGQRTPQQNHNMPTLNQPMDPPTQAKNERPPQPPPKQGQRSGTNVQPAAPVKNTPSNAGQQKPASSAMQAQQWARLPPQIQHHIRNLPEEGRRKYLLEMQAKQLAHRKLNAEAQAAQTSQFGAQAVTQGLPTGTNINQGSKPQAASNPSVGGPQQGINSFARVNAAQPQGQSQQGTLNVNRPPSKMMPMQLSESQEQHMDNQPFPPAILNRDGLGQLPENIKTWGQLKEFVKHSAQISSPGIMQNVKGLQSMHFQQIQQRALQAISDQKKKQHQQMSQAAQAHLHSGPGGPAPQAPMIPQPPTQPPVGQPPAPVNGPQGFAMSSLPQPTMGDLQHARAILPDNMKSISDSQLRQIIMQKRQTEYSNVNQSGLTPVQQLQHRNNPLQAQHQQGRLPPGQAPPNQLQQPIRGQAQQQQPSQPQHAFTQQQPQPNGQGRQSQSNKTSAQSIPPANQKGPKRNNSDDVIEVPDPKTAQQQGRPPNARQPPSSGMPQITPEMYAKMSAEQRMEAQRRLQAQAAHRAKLGMTGQGVQGHPPAPPAAQNAGQNQGKDGRLGQLIKEVEQTTPVRPVVPMSPRTRSQMIEGLKDSTGNMVHRIEQSLPIFLSKVQDEKQAKELLRMRLLLRRQVKDPDFNVPVENFTMTIQELDQFKNALHRYFAFMLKSFQPHPPPSATVQLPPGQPQQLNKANLQQQQAAINAARVATAQKGQANNNNNNNASNDNGKDNSNKAPAAPTSTHAPFIPFGSTSPQGVPQAYATQTSLTRDQLKLPPGKKRKPNQGASAATPATQAMDVSVNKASPVTKMPSSEVQRAPVVPSMMKCPVSDCETGKTGFATKEDLEKHRTEVHEPKDPVIKDPMDAALYAISSMQIALGLDEKGKPKPVAQESKADQAMPQAAAMKASASSQGQNPIKQEGATPMSRIPTQTGPSPSSNLLKTPQATVNVKTPASEAKSAGKNATAKAETAVNAAATATPDPWANSLVQPEWFQEVFSGVRNLNCPVPDDIITGWMARNPITPNTSPSSGEPDKDTPHKSDISANENLNITVAAGDEDWMWFDDGLPDDMEALDMGDLMDMDWDTAFGKPEDDVEVLGKGKRRRDPTEPSDEWLKAWAPEKYEERKKRDAQGKR